MTMISRLGYKPTKRQNLKAPILKATSEITIVIPVKDNQQGINLFLTEFFLTHSENSFPSEIIIVDNNSTPKIEIESYFPIPVRLFSCSKFGPASARNLGVLHSRTDWVLFTDSDCIPTSSLLWGYLSAQNGAVGYAGNIKSHGEDLISKYYEQQEILMPPKVYEGTNEPRPDYLVTANCLIWRPALNKVGGFNEEIKIAGGEDIDIGFKLLCIGQLAYAFDSVAKHNFNDGFTGFTKRFIRYGLGNKIIGSLYGLNLRPRPFRPNKTSLANYALALLQFLWLSIGYAKRSSN